MQLATGRSLLENLGDFFAVIIPPLRLVGFANECGDSQFVRHSFITPLGKIKPAPPLDIGSGLLAKNTEQFRIRVTLLAGAVGNTLLQGPFLLSSQTFGLLAGGQAIVPGYSARREPASGSMSESGRRFCRFRDECGSGYGAHHGPAGYAIHAL